MKVSLSFSHIMIEIASLNQNEETSKESYSVHWEKVDNNIRSGRTWMKEQSKTNLSHMRLNNEQLFIKEQDKLIISINTSEGSLGWEIKDENIVKSDLKDINNPQHEYYSFNQTNRDKNSEGSKIMLNKVMEKEIKKEVKFENITKQKWNSLNSISKPKGGRKIKISHNNSK